MRQLRLFEAEIPLADDAGPARDLRGEPQEDLRRKLAGRLGRPVSSLVLTENRVRFLSARRVSGGLAIRIHRSFVEASDEVLDAAARLCDHDVVGRERAAALAVAREYFAENGPELERSRKTRQLRPRGDVHDLSAIRERLNAECFRSELTVEITWGRNGSGNRDPRRGAIHLRLGSYDASRRLVRIHPVLDRTEVPEYVVEAIVYHEMLHAAEPPRKGRTRRRVHTREFRRRERAFREHDRAERWIAANLRKLARWRG